VVIDVVIDTPLILIVAVLFGGKLVQLMVKKLPGLPLAKFMVNVGAAVVCQQWI